MSDTVWRRQVRAVPAPAVMAAALAVLALAGPAPSSAAPRLPDRSHLAAGPDGLVLALVVHDGRLEAYACDGTARRAFFAARARRGRHVLRNANGDRLTVRLGARAARASLALNGGDRLALTARRTRRVAIFSVTIRRDGAVFGAAPNRGVLGAHLSPAGLVGALAFGSLAPRAFSEPGFAGGPLFVDGTPVPYPPDRAAQALTGEWRWIVTPNRILGATTSFVPSVLQDLAIPAGTKFIERVVDV